MLISSRARMTNTRRRRSNPPLLLYNIGDDHIDNTNEGARSKFNVSKDTAKRTCDGIVFDSCMEMRYYRDVILPLARSGEIKHYEMQKPFELQPKFYQSGKLIQPITYVADFYIEYVDGRAEVIDIKGCADSVARMKRKMFWYLYPDIPYRWLTYVVKYGGWIDYDEVAKLRRAAKKERKEKIRVQEEKEKTNG